MTDAAQRPGPFIRHSGHPIGFFVGPTLPTAPGLYEYMPLRNGPHRQMGLTLLAEDRALCTAADARETLTFHVTGNPRPHWLQIDSLHRNPTADAPDPATA